MVNIDLKEAHLTVEAEAVISSKERHCNSAASLELWVYVDDLGRDRLASKGDPMDA